MAKGLKGGLGGALKAGKRARREKASMSKKEKRSAKLERMAVASGVSRTSSSSVAKAQAKAPAGAARARRTFHDARLFLEAAPLAVVAKLVLGGGGDADDADAAAEPEPSTAAAEDAGARATRRDLMNALKRQCVTGGQFLLPNRVDDWLREAWRPLADPTFGYGFAFCDGVTGDTYDLVDREIRLGSGGRVAMNDLSTVAGRECRLVGVAESGDVLDVCLETDAGGALRLRGTLAKDGGEASPVLAAAVD